MSAQEGITSKVMLEALSRIETVGSFGPTGDFVAGAAFMAELFADGQGALRETLEAIRNDLRLLNARYRADTEGFSQSR